jgi:putative phage-type endonuclease
MNAHPDWLEARKTGIGGSDVAAILGLSRWKTPLAVYQEKRGEIPPQPDSEPMRWGRYLEPVVRQAYADETGREVRLPTELIRHPTHDFMIANIDGVVVDEERLFEAKTARSADGWGEPGTDQIPQAYLLQVQHYMKVTALPITDVAVLIGGSDFRLYEVRADHELQDMLVDAEREFWRAVQAAEPPEPVSYADVIARWGRASRADLVMADDDTLRALLRLRDLKAERERIEQDEEAEKALVLKSLGECDTLVGTDGKTLATWKAQKGAQRFDAAALKAEHPALHAQFLRVGEPFRRFLLK